MIIGKNPESIWPALREHCASYSVDDFDLQHVHFADLLPFLFFFLHWFLLLSLHTWSCIRAQTLHDKANGFCPRYYLDYSI